MSVHFIWGHSAIKKKERKILKIGKKQNCLSSHQMLWFCCCCSVAQLCPTLQRHGLQQAKLLYPLLSPGVCSNSTGWWCHPTISSSVAPFSSWPQPFPASGSFLVNQLFASGSQSIGASASASVLPMNIQGWFPLGLTGFTSFVGKVVSAF